jgi:type II secretory pathway component PulM
MENNSGLSLSDLNDRIAMIRDNIRQLVEQAAGATGAQDDELISARLEQQNMELEKLTKERDALITK